MRSIYMAVLAIITACGVDARDTEDTAVSASGPTSADATEGDSAEGGSDDGASDEDDKLDLADDGGVDGGDGGDGGCKKIDFLFVIDNSRSMETEQAFLEEAFPGFVSAIETVLPQATDFHIGVTTTDDFGLVPGTFMQQPAFAEDPCMTTLGALVHRSTPDDGNTGYGPECGFSSGARYMVNNPDLATEFGCAAKVGIRGYTGERHAGAATAALDPAILGPGACNEGFLRDDALLVLVVISDEDDDESLPDADAGVRTQAWFDAVQAAKGGIESNVVFLLVSGGSPKWTGCPPLDLGGTNGAGESDVLTAWASMFSNHTLGDVCQAGYADYLATSIATIETACDEFIPVD